MKEKRTKNLKLYIRQAFGINVLDIKMNLKAGEPEILTSRTPTAQSSGFNQRCATYVIDETRDSTNRHQQKQEQRANDDSSEEKPLKKRRKLQRRCVYEVDLRKDDEAEEAEKAEEEAEEEEEEDDDDERDDEGDDEEDTNVEESPKNERQCRCREGVKKVPETLPLLTKENKGPHKPILETESNTFGIFDYYRSKTTCCSDGSSARTDDEQLTLEFDDDFDDDNVSNASELVKEIDVSIMTSDLQSNFENVDVALAREDSHNDLICKIKGLNLSNFKSQQDDVTDKSKRTR
jgi:hypothetical protein